MISFVTPIKKKADSSAPAHFIVILFLFFLFIASISFLFATFFLFKISYDEFCNVLLSKLNKPDKVSLFKESFIPEKKYRFVQIIILILSIVSLLITAFFIRRRSLLQQKITTLLKEIVSIIKNQVQFLIQLNTLRFYLLILFGVQFIFFTYCAFTFPISYDEAWTYLNFTNKSILSSASYYPAPNNHVFFSILTNITNVIPIDDPKIKMRLINILFSIATSFVLLKLLCKFYSPRIALYTVMLFAFSYPVALYSMQARGYEMLLLFSLITTYCTISYIMLPSKKQLVIYLFSVAAGFYTIPTFLYFFISVQLFLVCFCLVKKQTALLKKFILADILAGAIVLILYAPIIFINGLEAITANSYVKSISFSQVINTLPEHVNYSLNWLLGTNMGGTFIVILLIISLLYTLLSKKTTAVYKTVSFLMLLLMLSPPFIMIIQRVIPFERTWVYLTIPLIFAIATILTIFLNAFSNLNFNRNKAFSIFFTTTAVLFMIKFIPDYKNKHPLDYQATDIFSTIDLKNLSTIASNEVLMTDLLTYEITVASKNKMIKIIKIEDATPIYADALILNNDLVTNISNISDYQFIKKNVFIQFYLKKTTGNE